MKIKVWEVHGGEDQSARVSYDYLIGYFTNYEDAKKAAKNAYDGFSGRRDGEIKEKTINIFESFEEYENFLKEQKLEKIKSKLTKEEKELLNLK